MEDLTRRSFLTAAALGATALGAASLTGCAPQAEKADDALSATGAAEDGGKYLALHDDMAERYDISATAAVREPIADDQIAETLEADVVIVGAGISGAIAAATCAEEGKSVIVFQKDEKAVSHGWGIAACNSQAQKDAGYDKDWLEVLNQWNRAGENRSRISVVIKNWIPYSGETIDWLYGLVNDVEGVGPMIAPPNIGATYDTDYTNTYATAHGWAGEMEAVAQWLIDYAIDLGKAEARYSTPAVQLKTDGSGAVTGVIAQQEDGSYVLGTGASVILAAGDYGHNDGLRAEFMPHIEGLPSAYSRMSNTGDGILMGHWVGGAIQASPHCGNIHYDPPVSVPDVPGSGQPWLSVNQNGQRFCNEDVVYGQIYAQDMNQPGLMHWQIFDGDFKAQCGTLGSGMMRTEPFPGYGDAIEEAAERGDCKRADTLEELAEQMGVPADAFVATVERYNALYEQGADEDFGKLAKYLTPIKTPPFYGVARQAGVLCTLNGLITDEDFRVLNENDEVIAGLYAVGNTQGGWFGGLEHQMMIPGMSLGRAAVSGRVAAKRACGADY
ncbi:FAD-dependent oxidoreductase [Adlercreutzia sp. R21]|uniref:FAD-dependent oxidoreductase n=1 Tax=Adlercreutzia wanghongyangiae TaxID=3111451 RepID=UPI002DB8E35C|nr:FAD-dependent oxidoreductase [Adlercreutzia sp. R21]MEC4184006.1 FAD-dependent oxidoreductase [Adlercreutzia sp. R21]